MTNLKIEKQPFQKGEKVRPHHNFKHYHPDVSEATIKTCEKGVCQTGWLVTIEEWKGEYDSSWFFKK